VRISADAMNTALNQFNTLRYPPEVAAAYEGFLAGKWFEAKDLKPTYNRIGEAVAELFQVFPGELGRLRPFRYDWKVSFDSGRKTVWNNNTREGFNKSKSLFTHNNIREGLVPGAAGLLEAMLPLDASKNPVRPSWQALAALVLRDHEFDENDQWADAQAELQKQLSLSRPELDAIASSVPLGVGLLGSPEWSPATVPEVLRPQEAVTVQIQDIAVHPTAPPEAQEVSVVVDSRVERMLRLALTAYSSILLVGPPGTGKGILLKWLIAKAQSEPEKYGFPPGFLPDPLWQTPDESWTAFELIGGFAPNDKGVLSWVPGALLRAIAADRWLVLDETNRADMDKIMGPLLTWLSQQEVEVGTTEAHGGVTVGLGWSSDRNSKVEPRSEPPAGRWYLAGADWRLLGTYNPQDAQRVFRFGQALSRRFVIIPVPVLKPGQFEQLLSKSYPHLPEPVSDAIVGLYSAHQAQSVTTLGPAVFLPIARYVLTGLPASSHTPDATEEASNSELAGSSSAQGEGHTLSASSPAEEPPLDSPDGLLYELIAEAYVIGLGRYLAGYDNTVFDVLGSKVIEENALNEEQWSWIQSQRDVLS
jgi:MoxR-like ATPase